MSSTNNPKRFGDLAPSAYPGERLGLPESGHRSIGRVGRRIGALAIDWAVACLIALAFSLPWGGWQTLAIFGALQIVLIPTIGGSLGHRLTGMRLLPLGGGYIGWWRPVVRTALLCIALPALVWDSDQRGFHDKIAGTVLIRS